jgi:tripartite-type tricarboxylate transporter receptor subunit TctC
MTATAIRLILGALVLLTAVLGSKSTDAQNYPIRPITVIVPFAGGSASDVVMRIMLDRMSRSIGQPFIIDNRPGAGGNTGTAAAVKAAPEGYTLVMSSVGPLAANLALYRDVGYDPAKDLAPISLVAHFPNLVVVNSKLPIASVADLIAYAKSRPKRLNYGSVGIGSSQHLAALYFEQVTGVEFTHVPYRNIAQYVPDLIAGTVPLGFQWLPNVSAPLQSGDAKALAVTVNKRMQALPNVPTAAEAGVKDYETSGWLALLAPRATPKPILAKLHHELEAAAADPAVRAKIIEQGAEPVVTSPEELAAFIASETVKWSAIITKGGIPVIQ